MKTSAGGTRTKRFSGLLFFILFLAACTAARCILSVLCGTAGALREETLNLELAQNIRLYGRLTVYGMQTNCAGILYPALLAPLFGIRDPETRLKAVCILNALLVSSALIPARLICRKLLQKESHRIAGILLFAVLPDLWLSAADLPENLFIPLAMWGIWFLVRAFGNGAPDLRRSCLLGLWAYLLFITSKSGIAAAGGILALYAYEAAAGREPGKAAAGCLGFAAAFAAAYLLAMAALYGGRPYFYPELAGGKITSPQQLMFWLYAVLCALLWFGAGSLFLPVLLPAACRKQQDQANGKLALFLSVYAVLAAALTAYAVSVSADFGRMDIRIVLRTFIPAAWLFTVLFLAMPENREERMSIRHPLIRASAWLAILCVLFLRIPQAGSPADAPAITVFGRPGGSRILTIAARAAAAALIAAGTVLWIRNRKKAVKACALAALLALGAVNGALMLKETRKDAFPDALKAEAAALGETLGTLDGSILVISSDAGSERQRLMDAFCDTDYYLIETDALTQMAIAAQEPGFIPADGTAWTEGEGTKALHFRGEAEKGIGQADYIVCHDAELKLTGGQYLDCTPEGVSFARVYRNGDPGRIDALDLFSLRAGDMISFTKENPAYLRFPVSGFSHPESGFTWSEGTETTITLIPAPEGETQADLFWTWKMTNAAQRFEVYAGEELLAEGTANGPGDMIIPVPEEMTGKREPVTFRFVFPDACQPANGDQRVLAVAFESVTLQGR